MKNDCIGRLIDVGISYDDAVSLRRISMTLHRWHELECGDDNGYSSYCIARGKRGAKATEFEYDDSGRPYLETHAHYGDGRAVYSGPIADRERGALKRLAAIMARYPGFASYVQGDPRGAALYIMAPDVLASLPNEKDASERNLSGYYSRGIAVYK